MSLLRRELRVALSKKAQPVWFRVAKWIVIIVLFILYRRSPYLWPTIGVLFVLALAFHFFYRFKTRGWTRQWGGWNDLDAGR